jgi:hypothetical protein
MPSLWDALRNIGKPKQVQAMSPEALAQISSAKFGVLANNKQAQQQFIQSTKVAQPNILQNTASAIKQAVPQVATATGLAASRMGVGTAQGVSGLYDLATPGTGNSRVTQGLNHAAQNIDSTAQNNGINPAYHIMQAALTPASFYAPGSLLKAIGGVPKALGETLPFATTAANSLAKGGTAARIAGQAMQGAKPINAINAAVSTASDLGRQAGQGQQITPLNAGVTAATNLATPFALPAAGQGLAEAGKVAPGLTKQGIQTALEKSAKALNVKPHAKLSDKEVQAAQAHMFVRQGYASGMDITPEQIINYNNFLKKAGVSGEDTNSINGIINDRQVYSDTKNRRAGNATEAVKSLKSAVKR